MPEATELPQPLFLQNISDGCFESDIYEYTPPSNPVVIFLQC
jgi:hypothetical protein